MVKVECGEPSPQSMSTAQGVSFTPGSLKLPSMKLVLAPSFAVWLAGAVTVGATLFTVTLEVLLSKPPSLSKILPLTVWAVGPWAGSAARGGGYECRARWAAAL